MSKIGKDRAIELTLIFLRVILGVIFILSSIPKIKQPYDFLASVYNFELVGPKLGMLVAMTLPWLELLAGICLIGGIFISGAMLICVVMGAMFMYVIISALVQGLTISCGCFGASSTDFINYSTLIRAGLIFILALAGYFMAIARNSISQKHSNLKSPR